VARRRDTPRLGSSSKEMRRFASSARFGMSCKVSPTPRCGTTIPHNQPAGDGKSGQRIRFMRLQISAICARRTLSVGGPFGSGRGRGTQWFWPTANKEFRTPATAPPARARIRTGSIKRFVFALPARLRWGRELHGARKTLRTKMLPRHIRCATKLSRQQFR
jgi:hypothetical protein